MGRGQRQQVCRTKGIMVGYIQGMDAKGRRDAVAQAGDRAARNLHGHRRGDQTWARS